MRKKMKQTKNHPSFKTSRIVFYRKIINIHVYIWHVDILKGNCIRKPNTVVEKKQDMNAMTWNLYTGKLSNLGM